MSGVEYVQLELPIWEVTLKEHAEKTGHGPDLYESQAKPGTMEWFCAHYSPQAGSCKASWPPPTRYEAAMEDAVLGLLRGERVQIGSMMVEYPHPNLGTVLRDEMTKGRITRGETLL